jgi:hypothetical protein
MGFARLNPSYRSRRSVKRSVSAFRRAKGYGDSLQFTRCFNVPSFSLEFLTPDAASRPQALSRLLDAAQKARIVFEPIIEPIILGPEAD